MNCELIKVCGMRTAENIREVESLGIDMMGFIFWPKSGRYVSERPSYLPTCCKRVGVFVGADIDDVVQHVADYALDAVQLHGAESPDYVRRLRSACDNSIVIIKAFNIATADDLAATASYTGLADYFLFDTKGKSVGGNGEHFDWRILSHYEGQTPFLLSGGIGPDDADRLRSTWSLDGFPAEKCAGIDLNSRFEKAPALKDVDALQKFFNELNKPINCK